VSTLSLIWGVCSALAVNECCELSPWAAQKIARWSAHLRYTDADRAKVRAEELAALVDGRPGKLFKLITAVGFGAAAFRVWAIRAVIRVWTARAPADASLVSVTPAGQLTLRRVIAASMLTAIAAFAILQVTPADTPVTSPNAFIVSLRSPSGGSAAGEATAHRAAGGWWSIQLTVHGLKGLSPDGWYKEWYVPTGQPGHPAPILAGTFAVPSDGSGTFTMTSAADPAAIASINITSAQPGDGGRLVHVILTGTTRRR
jgi:hypothetical protein